MADLGRALGQAETASLMLALALALVLPVPGGTGAAPAARAAAVATSPGRLVIGVTDSGCAFLNAVFRRGRAGESNIARHTRLHSLWQQGAPLGPPGPWQVPADLACGRELLATEIDALLAQVATPLDEAALYRQVGYPVDRQGQLLPVLRGTHVLDIAAGLAMGLPTSVSAKPQAVDAASRAALIFVDVPSPGPDGSTGAGADAYLLDALHCILARAAPGARVVVNISMGSLAGPHNGGSLIEMAIDDLLVQHPELTLTLAAGTGAEEPWHARGHTGPGLNGAVRGACLAAARHAGAPIGPAAAVHP